MGDVVSATDRLVRQLRSAIDWEEQASHHRRLAACDRRPPRPWVEIPRVEVRVLADRDDDSTATLFIKTILRLAAEASFEALPWDLADRRFTLLARYAEPGDHLSLELFCPYPAIADFMTDRLPPTHRQWRIHAVRTSLPVPVVHRYGLPRDVLTPISVSYGRGRPQIVFDNTHYLRDPSLFLTPRAEATTSEFLDFVGALAFSLATSPPPGLVDRLLEVATRDVWLRWLCHFADTGQAFDPERTLVSSDRPEEFDVVYPAARLPQQV
jgi:hypothetical protein